MARITPELLAEMQKYADNFAYNNSKTRESDPGWDAERKRWSVYKFRQAHADYAVGPEAEQIYAKVILK